MKGSYKYMLCWQNHLAADIRPFLLYKFSLLSILTLPKEVFFGGVHKSTTTVAGIVDRRPYKVAHLEQSMTDCSFQNFFDKTSRQENDASKYRTPFEYEDHAEPTPFTQHRGASFSPSRNPSDYFELSSIRPS